MPTTTYTPLANITLGSAQASISFSGISQSYRDLVLVFNPIVSTAGNGVFMTFNSDSAGNYANLIMRGNGSATSAWSYTAQPAIFVTFGSVDNTGTVTLANIQDYSASDKHKTALVRHNAVTAVTEAIVGRWGNTAAITTITLTGNGVNLSAGTSVALYGIAA